MKNHLFLFFWICAAAAAVMESGISFAAFPKSFIVVPGTMTVLPLMSPFTAQRATYSLDSDGVEK